MAFYLTIKIGKESMSKQIEKAIERAKTKLIKQAKTKGVYENFGQNEVRKIELMERAGTEDFYLVREFDQWCMNYTGRD